MYGNNLKQSRITMSFSGNDNAITVVH